MPAVRYIVSDIDAAVAFYRDLLSFAVDMDASPQFAALSREGLTLLINVPGAGSAGKAGGNPEPGGWNRFQIETDDLDAMVADLRGKGASFRGDAAEGPGGRAVLLLDPSGNPIEHPDKKRAALAGGPSRFYLSVSLRTALRSARRPAGCSQRSAPWAGRAWS